MSDETFNAKLVECLDHLSRAMTLMIYSEPQEAKRALDRARMVVGALRQTVQSVDEEEKTRA